MGRRARDDSDSGWFHVFNRGVDRCEIFRSGLDARHFLDLLGAHSVAHGVEVHAYCLLGNHYHVLFFAPDGGLSSVMQRLTSLYVRHFNERHERDGPLFRSRFRSIGVADETYLDTVGRYIHRNSYDRFPAMPPRAYRWSSMQWYVISGNKPDWLHTEKLLSFHSTRRSFEDFVASATLSRPANVDWAVQLALATCPDDDLVSLPRVDRTITALLNIGYAGECRDVSGRKAHERARRRLDQRPDIGRVVTIVRSLIDHGDRPNGAWHHPTD